MRPPAALQPRFEWIGGATPLDFTNTVTWTAEGLTNERLTSYPDLVAWAREAGLLSPRAAAGLLGAGRLHPERGRQALVRAHRLRAVLHQVFIAAAAGQSPERSAIRELNETLQDAFQQLQIDEARGQWRWGWTPPNHDLSPMLGPVAWSASELLTSEERGQLKSCAALDCGWLFLDRSRNHVRRWCDMQTCGNAAKARRFYAKTRAQGPS